MTAAGKALHDFQMEPTFRERRKAEPAVVLVGAPHFVGRMRSSARGAGLRPVCARDATEALAAILDEKPAMVLIDSALSDVERRRLVARMERSPWLARIPLAVAST